jgi:hypothetical protein
MTGRAALVLGIFILLAAVLHGGFYAAGHDFVVNRFTGQFQFVPAEEDDETRTPVLARDVRRWRALTSRGPGARVVTLQRRR